ncbi:MULTISPECIES: transcriptional regulator domain-containing protein [Mesorhizobium]
MRDYEAPEFAAEYLIRNDAFIAECSQLASLGANTGDLLGPTDFAARWGARFHCHR